MTTKALNEAQLVASTRQVSVNGIIERLDVPLFTCKRQDDAESVSRLVNTRVVLTLKVTVASIISGWSAHIPV